MFLFNILTFVSFMRALASDEQQPLRSPIACDPVAGSVWVTDLVPRLDTEGVWRKIGTSMEHTQNFTECLQGEQLACTIVGGKLMSGRDLPRDLDLSMGLLGPACDAGVGSACLGVAAYLSEHLPDSLDPYLVADLYARACAGAWTQPACFTQAFMPMANSFRRTMKQPRQY